MNYLPLNHCSVGRAIAKKLGLAILLPLLTINYAAAAGLPITIQAESYAAMKGISAATTSDKGKGLSVGWTDSRDWISYSATPVNIPATGSYKITYRVASANGGGSFIFRETGRGAIYDRVAVPKTGNWQAWVNVSRTITLTAGVHRFGINVVTGGFNFNWFKIEQINAASSQSPKPRSSSSSSRPASSTAAASSTASGTSVQIAGPVAINWGVPKKRENGKYLDITELGGYKLRYKLSAATNFTDITINDPWTNSYHFSWLEGNYVFQIAAFDKNGQYSDFVNVLEQ